ncbi:RecB family exonuclease [Frankia canadensis]|uniref:RecB family exonuclease n=1 Tax=Frankia canadensis TaxID=1836972 RepID=A0A2I2KRW9_9ACTN|nr:PD-(D/E)XK nuclease family protein [Frankia canadensis]SNQ48414.1 RecB family exonuclease [Frankia canadensis]SOU55704.1 RecB family exonuclease [Frankia canadensis]
MAQMELAGMPRRLFACTPSRLAAFEDCPRRYRMIYLDRPRPPKGPAWAHTSFGVSVHNALRRWWEEPIAARTPARAVQLVRLLWVEDGFRDAEHSAAWRERAAEMVAGYVGGLDPAAEPRGVERSVAARTDALAFSGRVDRLDERDGELVVVDYKTGRRPVTEQDARSSPALALYALAAGRMLRRPCHRVELHHVPTGRIAVAEHTDDSIARHVRRAESVASDAVAATEALGAGGDPDRAFPPRPGSLCSWCDYRRLCPQGQSAGPERQPWAALGDETAPVTEPRHGD